MRYLISSEIALVRDLKVIQTLATWRANGSIWYGEKDAEITFSTP